MSDYTQVNDYSAKDALSTGNPLKLIKGSDIDAEFAAISTAIASKFDTTDVASAAEAQAGTSNTVVITPGRLTSWAQNGAGVLEDIQQLADPGADRLLFFDFSAGSGAFLTLDTQFSITGTTLSLVTGAGGGASADLTLTAGTGLSGGGDLTANRTFDLDFSGMTAETAIVAADELAFYDASGVDMNKITFANLEASLTIANMSDYVASSFVDMSGVTLTAGSALSYSVGGTDLTASATIDFDLTELTADTSFDTAADYAIFYDASATANKKILLEDFVGAALGDAKYYVGTNQAVGAEADVDYDTAEYDALERGTFSTSANSYTSTSGGRIWIVAQVRIGAINDDESIQLFVEVGGVEKLVSYFYNDTDNDTPIQTVTVAGTLNLSASDVVKVRCATSSSETIVAGTQYSYVSIVELS